MTTSTEDTSPRRSRGWVAVVAALLTGGLAGVLGGYLVDGAGERDAVELREPPAEFPAADQDYLPEVVASAIEEWISANDYECEVLTETDFADRGSPSGAEHWLSCRAPSDHGALTAQVSVEYDDDTRVKVVTARCERGPLTHQDYCPSVFLRTAENVFANQAEFQEEAMRWAEENHRNDAITIIGGIQLRADLGAHDMRFVAAS